MNWTRAYIIIIIIFLSTPCYSQNQNNIWYFGNKAGLNFNTNPPSTLVDGVFVHTEGVSSVCDGNGDLLFFTNGINVWNANKQPMPNGTGLSGNNSSSQILVVPKPGDCDIYYIFTTPSQNPEGSINYSIVDMSADFNRGDVISKNNFLATSSSERVTATFQSNGIDYWVVAQELGTNKFLSFSLTNTGINVTPIISTAGLVNDQINDAVGCMKFSSDGKKLCTANELGNEKCQLFDFDTQTGIVSNGFVISNTPAYGVEFSDDDSKIYFSGFRKLRISQFDLSSNNPPTIVNSETVLISSTITTENGGALQLGSDKKIYIARNNKAFLDVIQNPNLQGTSCGYLANAINLNSRVCFSGLPNLIKNYSTNICGSLKATYTQSNLCISNSVTITILATYGTAPYQYSLDGTSFQNSNIFSNLIAQDYEITAKDANGIVRKKTLSIPATNVFSLSIAEITQPECGVNNGQVVLKSVNGIAPFQFSKDGINFQTSNIFANLPESSFNFFVKDSNGCIATKQINLSSINSAKIFAGRDTFIFINQTIPLFAKNLTNSNFLNFKWIPAEGLDNAAIQNPTATISNNIEYIVEAATVAGCVARDTIKINVFKEIDILVPTAFTPNNDNVNDILKAIPRGIKRLNYFTIYDRYGRIIFSTNNFSLGWDGKIKGVLQNTGSYVWQAEGIDVNENLVYRKGSFSLIQ
jgi:gliding motility-associated-like protein